MLTGRVEHWKTRAGEFDLQRKELGREAREAAREAAKELKERDRSIKTLEKQVEKLTASAARLEERAEKRKGVSLNEVVLQPAARPEAKKTGAAAPKPAAKPKARRDDLQELPGVGPALEKRLRKAGIGSYEAVATLDKAGIETLAEKTGIAPQMIRREKWVTTARRLHRDKYGEKV